MLFCSILYYTIPYYTVLIYSKQFFSEEFYAYLFYSILFYSILFATAYGIWFTVDTVYGLRLIRCMAYGGYGVWLTVDTVCAAPRLQYSIVPTHIQVLPSPALTQCIHFLSLSLLLLLLISLLSM